jgi:uncharacterized protein
MSGRFFWHELMTTDAKAAEKFYGDVVGWTAKDSGAPGDHPYTLFHVGDRGIAGMLQISPDMAQHGARPGWLGYIATDDVDRTVARITQEGGKTYMGPHEVPDVIRFAMMADPDGAPFYVGKGLIDNPPTPLPIGTPGTVGWNELMSNNWEAAFAFYSKIFGWTKAEAHDMGPMGIYQLFAAGGPPIGGMMTKPPQVPVAHWGYYFNIEAIDAGAERITKGGGTIVNGPIEVPGGQWVVQAVDPQGAHFNLVAVKR